MERRIPSDRIDALPQGGRDLLVAWMTAAGAGPSTLSLSEMLEFLQEFALPFPLGISSVAIELYRLDTSASVTLNVHDAALADEDSIPCYGDSLLEALWEGVKELLEIACRNSLDVNSNL